MGTEQMATERFMQKHYGPNGYVAKSSRMGLAEISVSGLWLRRTGNSVEMLAERPDNHEWYVIARETLDSQFSHIAEPSGVQAKFDDEAAQN